MNKKLLIFLLILIILGGLYYYFFRYKNLDFKKDIEERLREKMKNVENVKDKTLKELEQIKKEKIENSKDKTSDFVLSKKDKIISDLKEKLGEEILNFSQNLNKIAVNLKEKKVEEVDFIKDNKFYFPPPQASIVFKKDLLFSVAIKGPGIYEIDWGDGEKDFGEVKQEKVYVLNHVFKEVGDYEIKVRIKKDNNDFLNYSFPVRVY